MSTTNRLLISLALVSILFSSCANRKDKTTSSPTEVQETESVTDQYFKAIDKYLTDVVGKGYASGEVTIPYYDYISVDDSTEDIQVWGDFWVENYNISSDTLLFVSGGNHSGKMHVKKSSDGQFFVCGFDAVGDGSEYLPSAKAIFGDRFDDFQKAYSDNRAREEIRKSVISEYTHSNKLAVKYYKDYGWPAIRIPE